jgi:hypothetical protein
MKRKSLIALAWWFTEKIKIRQAIIIESKVEYDSSKGELLIDKPKKFKYDEWLDGEKSVYMYLLYSVKNSIGTLLVYVIRKPIIIHSQSDSSTTVGFTKWTFFSPSTTRLTRR